MGEPRFIPYEEAKKIVGEVVEMEHPTNEEKRIFNVYDHRGKAICWFDADEVESASEAGEYQDVIEHILPFVPDWAV